MSRRGDADSRFWGRFWGIFSAHFIVRNRGLRANSRRNPDPLYEHLGA